MEGCGGQEAVVAVEWKERGVGRGLMKGESRGILTLQIPECANIL